MFSCNTYFGAIMYHPRPAPIGRLRSWLSSERKANGRYRHHFLRERRGDRSDIVEDLQIAVDHASEDVRRKLRKVLDQSLDPFGVAPAYDPARGYPEYLDYITRKGYFGELLSGLIVLTFGAHGLETWEIPAFLFRFHEAAFQYLARQHQSNPVDAPDLEAIDEKPRMPGRTGDDCLAFHRDSSGVITRALFCEAKCSHGHKNEYIVDAHEKASEIYLKPVDLRQLIELLRDYDDPESIAWREALWRLYLHDLPDSYERCDLVCYVYGQPSRNNEARLPVNRPHQSYTASRRLEAVEVHVNDVRSLVDAVYRPVERHEHEHTSS